MDLFALPGAASKAAPLVRIEFPGLPRGKGRPRSRIASTATGRAFVHVYTDAKTVQYEKALAWQAKAAMRGRAPLAGPLAVRVFAMMPIPASWPRRDREAALAGTKFHMTTPDSDNLAKSIDALNGIVWLDDDQIVCLMVLKEYGADPG